MQAGRVIVTTIHQPSSRMFHMFDKLVLLSEGHPLYSGYAGEAMEYFDSLSIAPQLAMNPAEFLLDLASGVTSDITVPEDLDSGQRRNQSNSQFQIEEAESQREIILEVRMQICPTPFHVLCMHLLQRTLVGNHLEVVSKTWPH